MIVASSNFNLFALACNFHVNLIIIPINEELILSQLVRLDALITELSTELITEETCFAEQQAAP